MDRTFIPQTIDPGTIVEMDDGIIVKIGETLHTFNITGREIIELFDGVRSIGDIIEEMEARYPGNEEVAPAVESFFGELEGLNILDRTE